MPLHPIVIDTHHLLTATTVDLVVVVAIVTAIQENMTQEGIMIPVAITVRGMVIQHRVTAVSVVDRWIKILTDQEVRWEVEPVVTVGEVVTGQVKMSKEVSVIQQVIRQGRQIRVPPMVTID